VIPLWLRHPWRALQRRPHRKAEQRALLEGLRQPRGDHVTQVDLDKGVFDFDIPTTDAAGNEGRVRVAINLDQEKTNP
jgi:hypothetical protein